MKPEEVTAQILGAWEEATEEEQPTTEPPEEEVSAGDEPEETPAEEAPEEEEVDEEADEEEEPEAEEVQAAFDSDDPEVQAFLAKYQGDPVAALRGAVELQRVLGRQGSEKAAALERVNELEAQLQQATAFQPSGGTFLTAEQAEWVEEAVGSQNPTLYIQRAVQEGEFELARAVAREYARENPFDGNRLGQQIDAIELQQWEAAQAPQQSEPVDTGVLLNVLADNFPDMRNYEPQMVTILNQWGANHPLVLDARSGDIPTAAKAIIAIYEAARASTASVQDARNGLKRRNRQAGDEAREAAVVSSATASPSAGETPRSRPIMPGLSREDFEAAFSQQ